ncbi:SlyX family protein [Rhodovibrionaceae bacterium A322]
MPEMPQADQPAPSGDMESRVMELESRLAHQENMLDDLNGIVVSQQREIDDLTRKLEMMISRVREVEQGGSALPANDGPPPHY